MRSERHQSRTARLAEYLKARPDQWIDGRDLAAIAGVYAWRTRISQARHVYALDIENRQRRVRTARGDTVTVSEYRLKQSGPSDAPTSARA